MAVCAKAGMAASSRGQGPGTLSGGWLPCGPLYSASKSPRPLSSGIGGWVRSSDSLIMARSSTAVRCPRSPGPPSKPGIVCPVSPLEGIKRTAGSHPDKGDSGRAMPGDWHVIQTVICAKAEKAASPRGQGPGTLSGGWLPCGPLYSACKSPRPLSSDIGGWVCLFGQDDRALSRVRSRLSALSPVLWRRPVFAGTAVS